MSNIKKVVLILMCVLLCGCASKKYKAKYQTISCYKMIEVLDKGNSYLVDVRDTSKYNKTHMDNSVNIPIDKIDSITDTLSKDSIIIVYADTKKDSKKATNKIIDMGYSLVYDLGTINTCK